MFQDEPAWQPAPPPPPPALALGEHPWRLSDVIVGSALLVTGFAATFLLAVLFVVTQGAAEDDPRTAAMFVGATLLLEVWAGVLVIAIARSRHIPLRALGFRPPRSWSMVPLAVLAAYSAVIAYSMAVAAVEAATGWDLSSIREGNRIPDDLPRTPLVWTLLGLAVVVAAPLGEELFFRGLLYRGLAAAAGPTLAIVISGLAFSAVHLNVSVVVPFALIGMVFAWVYRASGSLWTSIAAHAIFNGVSFAFAVAGVGS